jgi:hypothetical protein
MNMYLGLKHAHTLFAVLMIFLTVVWSIIAWRSRSGEPGLASNAKRLYIGHRIIAGMAAITGIAVTFIGPWRVMYFPYIGLAAFIVHELVASVSKRFLSSDADTAKRRAALLIQLVTLAILTHVMVAKPL